ncbi:MAG: DUF503 domain-containing protein [Armatimonadota bacterium]|nr:DUF503 domain-containing protein [Armatimonadota bacterium]MCX7777982.1 DUF503 domain-containing protein [Armatimonadota bacterium]MDW8026147.1 DUF503 domain-containing protein [Armatimonadota bacterium]
MVIGVCTVQLQMSESLSLKDKRRILQSLISRIRNNFNVSITEVDYKDERARAKLAIACVSTDGEFATKTINRIISLIEQDPRVLLEDYSVEML